MKRICLNCPTEITITKFNTQKIYCCDNCKYQFNKKHIAEITKKRLKRKVLTTSKF
jgi:hypothetical protein